MKRLTFVAGSFLALGALVAGAAELKNGAEFSMEDLPEEMTVHLKRGGAVRFLVEENGTTGYEWTASFASNECTVAVEHRGADTSTGLCGAPGKAAFTITKNAAVQSPSLVEFAYARSWEKDVAPAKKTRLVLYTVPGEAVDFRYPASRTLNMLKAECANRGIELVDWHVHIRGGLTPAMAAERERACGIRQSAMENHGREWEIFDNDRLAAFADAAKKATVNGHSLPVGIQVNDRDWFRQIDAKTRAKFDYVLADTMIMGKLPNGRDRRLWLVKDLSEIGDPEKWMDEYVAMNLQILGEPISILANPGYLPAPLDAMHDRLWTDARMKKVIAKAVARGIAIEIQAESPYPSVRFLKMAKKMGAKFSFGTNNYDAAPKDLSRWLEAIVWLDLRGSDIWTPKCLRTRTLAAPHPLAVWDFDGTILKGDCSEGLREDGKTVYPGLVADCIRAGFASAYRDADGAARFWREYEAKIAAGRKREAYEDVARIFAGADVVQIEAFARRRFAETMRPHLFEYSMRRFRELEAAGVENHVVSASPDFFVQAAAETLGVPRDRIHGIPMAVRDGKLLDKVEEPFPYGDGKMEWVRLLEKQSGGKALHGFGNSYGTDGPFLKAIAQQGGTSVMINGGKTVPGMTELFVCTNLSATVGVAPAKSAAVLPCCGGGDAHLAWKIRDVPTWTLHGDGDDAVPVCRSRDMVAAEL